MSSENNCPAPTLSAGQKRHGFQVLRVEKIADLRVTAYEMEHETTGAKVLHLHCHDRENLYAIGFRTPPVDSTGVPHILEHSVLAGSEKFPLKDTFNELLKGSLQTFINAFTYPDKTIYPVASQVRTDFFNLARVYTDLVLRPRLLKESFYQEGHHLEFTDPDDPESELTVSGIVYNEMKGAYSSPDALMFKAIQESLFPDNTYNHDSGGDPEVIPRLTYEQFRAFHRTFYSPSNARIFLYGDIPTADHLEFLAEMLGGFVRIKVESAIASQKIYPLSKGETTGGKTSVNCAWMLAENTEVETALLLKITCAMLVGSSAGPLRKALIDSHLGEDLSPVTGLELDFKQMIFSVGLRGTDPEKAPLIEELILSTLQKVYENSFDGELVEGTLHQVEFHGKEIVRTTLPYGIVLMGAAYHTWLYDGDPLEGLNFPRAISRIRKTWEENPAVFQETVKKWLIDNRHRVLSILEPSATCLEEREEAFRKKMSEQKAALSSADLEKIRADSVALRRFQTEPDPPETAATLPRLRISDISRKTDEIPTEKTSLHNLPVLKHDLFTNGIAYIDMAFDISDVPDDLQPYLPLLGKLTVNMGAAGLDYEAMAKRIALKAGGMSFHLAAGKNTDGRRNWQKMIFQAKALYRNTAETVSILKDILTTGDLSHKERMLDLIAEKKNGLNAAVIPSGHVFARRVAASTLCLPAYRDEQWHGRAQLRFINRIAEEGQTGIKELKEKLTRLRLLVFRRERLTLNMTADQEGLSLLSEAAAALLSQLPADPGTGNPEEILLSAPVHLGVAVPTQVSYVAKAFPAPGYADPLTAPLLVTAKLLSNGYLYKHIRVQGGAYGGMCQYDPLNGLFVFLSYRDPHIAETLHVYSGAPAFLAEVKIEREEMEKAVIGTIGALDKPMDPSTRGYVAMIRDFAGLDDKMRLQLRCRILDMDEGLLREDVSRFMTPAEASAVIAVFGEESRLRAANEVLKTKLKVEPLL
jgi:Zn-dependent M16 (insulinase) family peptidase